MAKAWGSRSGAAPSPGRGAVHVTFSCARRRRGSRGSLALPVLYRFLWSGRILCSWISSTCSFRLFTIFFCLITNKVGQNISDEVWEELGFSMQVRQAGGWPDTGASSGLLALKTWNSRDTRSSIRWRMTWVSQSIVHFYQTLSEDTELRSPQREYFQHKKTKKLDAL